MMEQTHATPGRRPTRIGAFLRTGRARFLASESAAISPMFALMLIPIAGSVAFAVELGGMQYVQRSMQNAADAAALAAASNNNQTGTGTTPQIEARAAARPYGYVNGQNSATVTATQLMACPPGVVAGSTCYQAVVTSTFPLSFSRVVNFLGSSGSGRQLISATAVATAAGGGGAEDICVWSLSPQSNSFTSNGGPRPDMSGCSLLSNGGMTCNGHNLGADYGIAVGQSNGCGLQQANIPNAPADPYSSLASNIPAGALGSCGGSFPQLTGNGNNQTVVPSNRIAAGTPAWTGTTRTYCGDIQLQGNVTLTGTTTLIIENGRLDLNGYNLRTANGAAATVIFSGTNGATYKHYPIGGGTLEIEAPNSGPWSGVAIYQDPAVTTNTSFTYSGNSPTWNITGLVYLPHANVTFSGVVNKAADGVSCFVLVAYSVLVNGTAQIFANTQCASAGLGAPSVTLGSSLREKLVL